MIATHHIQNISFDKDYLYLQIDGKKLKISLEKTSKKLHEANDMQRMLYKISPSGYGIHWPLIDEDLEVNALLNVS